jgi:hypothetical protein
MTEFRRYMITALLLTGFLGVSTLTQAQSAQAPRAPTVPGVSRAIEHPDPTVDQTQPDTAHQPETAVDPPSSGPETATDKPKKAPTQPGVRSNTPPATAKPPAKATPPG